LIEVSSFKSSANIIGIGKLIARLLIDKVNVFLKARQKAGSFRNISKYLRPTQSDPNGDIPGRCLLNARILPNIGIYLKTMKYATGSSMSA
jgi:hypothetical protein